MAVDSFIYRPENQYSSHAKTANRLGRDGSCRAPWPSARGMTSVTVIKEIRSGEKVYDLEFGVRKVRWPGRTELLTLVVVDGLGQNPLMLLTNCKVTRSRKSLWRIVTSYLSRWRVEETIRFIKASYGLEDFRILKYERLRNLAMLVLVTAYFASVYLGKRATLAILVQHIERAAKRIYDVPEFCFYAIADGIKQLLFGRAAGIGPSRRNPHSNRLPLFS